MNVNFIISDDYSYVEVEVYSREETCRSILHFPSKYVDCNNLLWDKIIEHENINHSLANLKHEYVGRVDTLLTMQEAFNRIIFGLQLIIEDVLNERFYS